MPTQKTKKLPDTIKQRIADMIQAMSPLREAPHLDSGIDYSSSKDVQFDISETEFVREMNELMESATDSVAASMNMLKIPTLTVPIDEGDSGVQTLAKDIRAGDTEIHIVRTSDNDRFWITKDDRVNRIGIHPKFDPDFNFTDDTFAYDRATAYANEDIILRLESPIPESYVNGLGMINSQGEFTVPANLVVVRRHKVISGDDLLPPALDASLTAIENGLDKLNNAIDAVVDSNAIDIVCCLLRQMAALSSARLNDAALYSAQHLTPSDKLIEQINELRDFVVQARIVATITLTNRQFNFKFMGINIYKIAVDSILAALAATMQVVFRNAKDKIYSIAFGILRRNKIVNCMPFYGLIRGLLTWLFSPKGILGWLAGYTFQFVSRTRAFFQKDVNELEQSLSTQINFEKLIYFLDSIIAAAENMELCQDIIEDKLAPQTGSKGDAITIVPKEEEEEDDDTTISSGSAVDTRLGSGDDSGSGDGGTSSSTSSDSDFDGIVDLIINPSGGSAGKSVQNVTELEATGAEALALIIQPSDSEIEQFMINRLGADPESARDAVYRSKLGDCASGLDAAELSSVIQALQDAGLEL